MGKKQKTAMQFHRNFISIKWVSTKCMEDYFSTFLFCSEYMWSEILGRDKRRVRSLFLRLHDWDEDTGIPIKEMYVKNFFSVSGYRLASKKTMEDLQELLDAKDGLDYDEDFGIYSFYKKDLVGGRVTQLQHNESRMRASLPYGLSLPVEETLSSRMSNGKFAGPKWTICGNGSPYGVTLVGPKGRKEDVTAMFMNLQPPVIRPPVESICGNEYALMLATGKHQSGDPRTPPQKNRLRRMESPLDALLTPDDPDPSPLTDLATSPSPAVTRSKVAKALSEVPDPLSKPFAAPAAAAAAAAAAADDGDKVAADESDGEPADPAPAPVTPTVVSAPTTPATPGKPKKGSPTRISKKSSAEPSAAPAAGNDDSGAQDDDEPKIVED